MIIGNPAFCLFLYLTGVHFRGELQHGGDVSECKIKYRLIRTRGKGGVSLSDVLYVRRLVNIKNFKRNNSIMYMVYDVAFRLEKMKARKI